jgi:signal transduction histidine kinase
MKRLTWLSPIRSRRIRRLRPQRAVIVLSAALVIGYGATILISLRHAYRQTLRDATATLEGMARSAETVTSHLLLEIDATLLGVDRMLATVFLGRQWDEPLIGTLLRQFDEQKLAIGEILILDDKGREVNSSRASGAAARDYAASNFFTVHRAAREPALFIGSPEQGGANGGWLMMMSRPLMRDGVFRGVIAAVVPITGFTDFFSTIAATDATRISLLLNNGILVASDTEQRETIGRAPISALPLLTAAAKDRAGLVEVSEDGIAGEGLQSFRRLPDFPLIVTVSRGLSDILRQWRKERTETLAEFALFACTAATLVWLVLYGMKGQQLAAVHLRRSEARLTRQSSLLQSTLENIDEGLSVFDSRGRLCAWNSRFCELLDLPPDLGVGAPLRDILLLQAVRGDFGDDEPEAEVRQRLERFFRDVPTVKERVTPGGRNIQIRRRAMPDGAVVSVYSDITEIRASERRLIQARSQAETANRSKSDFLANMSHELRTPLNAIIGFSEIISHELFGPIGNAKYLEYMMDIHKSSLHLLSIINDVLDMSKIEAGKLELSKEALDIEVVVTDVIRMMRERAESRGIELIAQWVDKEVGIWADERAMKQIFLNLLSNAIEFSRDGGKVYIRVITEQPTLAVIEFEDCGIGMNEEEQERALQPFGQAKPATTRNYGGTGLGLPITKGLVEAHGGKLTIQSRPGHGTIVRAVLPIERRVLTPSA